MTNSANLHLPISEKQEGEQKDIEAFAEFATFQEAAQFFETVKRRLLDVNNWRSLCGRASADFVLTDQKGNKVDEPARQGFHVRIDIPGPGSKEGDGFDWVRVEAIEEGGDMEHDIEFIIMSVRPSANPANNYKQVAHFFSDKATSNFLVMREKKVVKAAVLGRNEVVNTEKSAGLLEKLRNAVIGIGAALGMSNPQWKSLVHGLIGKV